MKTLAIIGLIGMITVQPSYDLAGLRTVYASAALHKTDYVRLKQMLAPAPATPVFNCYRGAAEVMAAKYAINPINKLSAFAKGKQLIEKSIAADSGNVECRFIRYGIQRNVPVVLNYYNQLKNDSTLIIQALETLKDQDLKKRILNFMKHD